MAQKEIHPLARVSRKSKLKYLLYILVIITILNISFFLYFSTHTGDNQNIKTQKIVKKTFQQNPEKKISTPVKIDKKNLNYQQINDLNKKDIEKIKKDIIESNIKQLSFIQNPKENNDKNKKLSGTSVKSKKDFNYYYKKAKKAERRGDLKSALAFYHRAYKFNPDEDILYKIAYLNYKLEAYRGATRYSKKILKNNPNYVDAYILLAKIYEKLNNPKKALLTLEEAYYKVGDNSKLLRQLAKMYEESGNIYSAIEIYEILSGKGNLEDIIKTAKLYEKINIYDKALQYYKLALKKDKNGKYKEWLKDKIAKLSNMTR